jgi:hypothetical protein
VGKTPELTMLSRLLAMARRKADRKVVVTTRHTFAPEADGTGVGSGSVLLIGPPSGKAAERLRRHARFFDSVSVLEPNVKESPGGLRDYHTALWTGAMRFGAGSLEELLTAGASR